MGSWPRYRVVVQCFGRLQIPARPNLAEAHEYMGEALLALGKVEQARKHLAILEQINPKLAEELRADIQRHERS